MKNNKKDSFRGEMQNKGGVISEPDCLCIKIIKERLNYLVKEHEQDKMQIPAIIKSRINEYRYLLKLITRQLKGE